MDSENVKNQELSTADQTTGNSESYGRAAGNYQKEYRSVTGRRPRIHTQHSASASTQSEDGGFRPEGFGSGLGSQQQGGYQPRQGGYQPRQQGGYQQRGGYQPRQQGGYRPRYNQDGEQQQGGYQPRQQGGYRPRYNQDGEQQQGGYQPR
ncbi:MAG: pseudouridine synthase, partial [Prevotella sp.]|nr:pseudouridine synthase [Leyella stercorea]MDY4088499.1 pseudouridine synthase [Prevotella sp.]